MLLARGESGYETLVSSGRAPLHDWATLNTWDELTGLLDGIASGEKVYDVLGIDALAGAERLLHEHVCQKEFRGEWGEKGFMSFHKGYEMALVPLNTLLAQLDRIRARGTHVVLLSHCKIRTFKNPDGEDFDRWVSDAHEKTFNMVHRWSDAVLFGTFRAIVDETGGKRSGKKKGIGQGDRVLYTVHTDSRDAKNRFGMPPELDIPNDPMQIWPTISAYFPRKGK